MFTPFEPEARVLQGMYGERSDRVRKSCYQGLPVLIHNHMLIEWVPPSRPELAWPLLGRPGRFPNLSLLTQKHIVT